jgi:hypothetical protein
MAEDGITPSLVERPLSLACACSRMPLCEPSQESARVDRRWLLYMIGGRGRPYVTPVTDQDIHNKGGLGERFDVNLPSIYSIPN